MGYFNRFLLLIYTLVIATASLGVIVLWFHILPTDAVLNEVKFLLTRWETIAVAVALFLWSVHLLGCSVSGVGKKDRLQEEMLLLSGATGNVSLSVGAAKNLVEKVALSVSGVRDVKSEVHPGSLKEGKSNLNICLRLVVGQEARVTDIADSVRSDVMKQINQVLGLTDCKVDVDISDLASGIPSKGSRVA